MEALVPAKIEVSGGVWVCRVVAPPRLPDIRLSDKRVEVVAGLRVIAFSPGRAGWCYGLRVLGGPQPGPVAAPELRDRTFIPVTEERHWADRDSPGASAHVRYIEPNMLWLEQVEVARLGLYDSDGLTGTHPR